MRDTSTSRIKAWEEKKGLEPLVVRIPKTLRRRVDARRARRGQTLSEFVTDALRMWDRNVPESQDPQVLQANLKKKAELQQKGPIT